MGPLFDSRRVLSDFFFSLPEKIVVGQIKFRDLCFWILKKLPVYGKSKMSIFFKTLYKLIFGIN